MAMHCQYDIPVFEAILIMTTRIVMPASPCFVMHEDAVGEYRTTNTIGTLCPIDDELHLYGCRITTS